MSTATRVPLAQAERLAAELADALAPYCERVEIAGSIRRHKPEVKDIELVVVPRLTPVVNLFGEVTEDIDHLHAAVGDWVREGRLAHRLDKNGRPAFGHRYMRLMYQGVGLDLFSVLPPAQFGMIYLIRTGSADFSARLMTQRRFGGGMPDGWHVKEGALRDDAGNVIPTPEEIDVFRALGMAYVEPETRR